MKIIDTHVHLGLSSFTGLETTEDEIIAAMDRQGITASLVMPQAMRTGFREIHQRIAAMSRSYPGRIFGIASVDPWLNDEDYRREIEFCLGELNFVAIKLNPMGHAILPNAKRCEKIYELAAAYGVPVLIHTGLGNPHALPSLAIEPARRFPGVRFILSHAGFALYTEEAIVAARCCENIILEPSWCPGYTIRQMIEAVGRSLLIMGSDHPTNIAVELVKYESIGLGEQERADIFFHNPQRLFRLAL